MNSKAKQFKTEGYLVIKDFFSEYQVEVLKNLTRKLENNCSKIIEAEDAGFSLPNRAIISREIFDVTKLKQGTDFG